MEGGLGTEPAHQVRYYTLTFDGHNVQKRTSAKRQVGDRLPVIYLADDPNSVVRGSRDLQRSLDRSDGTLAVAPIEVQNAHVVQQPGDFSAVLESVLDLQRVFEHCQSPFALTAV